MYFLRCMYSSKSNGLDFRSSDKRLHYNSRTDSGQDIMSQTQLTSSVRNITSGLRQQSQKQLTVERRLKHLQTVVDDVRVSIGRALSVVSDSSMASKYKHIISFISCMLIQFVRFVTVYSYTLWRWSWIVCGIAVWAFHSHPLRMVFSFLSLLLESL